LKALVHPAQISDSQGGRQILLSIGNTLPRLTHLWTDQGYKTSFVDWVRYELGWSVEVVQPPYRPRGDTAQAIRDLIGDDEFERRWPKGFQVLKWRWIVERTFAWLGKHRRLGKDFELRPDTTETWIYLAMSRLMLRRLALNPT
jgi:putative transposase